MSYLALRDHCDTVTTIDISALKFPIKLVMSHHGKTHFYEINKNFIGEFKDKIELTFNLNEVVR